MAKEELGMASIPCTNPPVMYRNWPSCRKGNARLPSNTLDPEVKLELFKLLHQ